MINGKPDKTRLSSALNCAATEGGTKTGSLTAASQKGRQTFHKVVQWHV